jgi:hypothetical protein
MGFTYRHAGVPEDVIFTEALFEGHPGDREPILAEMNAITEARSSTQPVNTRTGGSTFKNPPGHKAWELVDKAGCRGLRRGDAQVSELHCNFLINHGSATASDIEGPRRGSASPRAGDVRRRARMGDQAGRFGLNASAPFELTQNGDEERAHGEACRRPDGRLVGREGGQPFDGSGLLPCPRRGGL